MPDHDGALALLERLARAQGKSRCCRSTGSATSRAGARARSSISAGSRSARHLRPGQLDDALYCLQPVAEHGSDRAHELLQEVYGRQARAPQGQQATLVGGMSATPTLLPTTRPQAVAEVEIESDAKGSAEVAALRKQVHEAIATRRHDEAAEHCRALLELEPSDPEAFNLLESHYRKRRDFPGCATC